MNRTPIKGHKHKQTQATDIPPRVKAIVHERDEGCSIFSGTPVDVYYSCCHYIPRTKGGLGIEQNIFTATEAEHKLFDKGPKEVRGKMRSRVKTYLMTYYADWEWTEDKLIYKKEF